MAGESRERTFLPCWSGPEPKDRLCPKDKGATSGWRAAHDPSTHKKRGAENGATTNQRTFIMCKRQVMTGIFYYKVLQHT